MRPEILFHEGSPGRPLIVLIHGMGMNMRIWSEPSCIKVMGGAYPLSAVLDKRFGEMRTLYSDLRERDFSLLSWSQSRPVGPLQVAVGELADVIAQHRGSAGKGILLIGHSRGGLIGRRYLEEKGAGIKGLVTIAAPHRGTTLAGWSAYLSPMALFLKTVTGLAGGGKINTAMTKISGFLRSEGLREMLPGSSLCSGLKETGVEGVRAFSVGGTNPDLVRIGNVSLLDLFRRMMPADSVPEEIRAGYGDGLVSALSSVLPYGEEHRNFPLNHVTLLFDEEVREYVVGKVERLS